jgi:hypothetical protein
MNRRKTVIAIAPVAPPCFESRSQWLTYLADAASEQRTLHAPGPLTIAPGEAPRFNFGFRFCADCTQQHSLKAQQSGVCKPDFLIELHRHQQAQAPADTPTEPA